MADIRDLTTPPRRGRRPKGEPRARRHWRGADEPLRRARLVGWRELRPALLAGALIGLAAAELAPGGAQSPAPAAEPRFAAAFAFCGGGRRDDCVIDGDTFRMAGERIRIADIDTPETHPPRCPEEAALGARATQRLHALLNAGPFELEPIGRDADRYGRKLRLVVRDGRSLGDVLVTEGLARPYGGGRRPWCA